MLTGNSLSFTLQILLYEEVNGRRGNLYIKVRIVNPKVLSEELKEEYLKIKNKVKI
jgi:DnaJ-class molecular chaperone